MMRQLTSFLTSDKNKLRGENFHFNQAVIDNWQQELDDIPYKITLKEAVARENTSQIAALQPSLSEYTSSVNELGTKRIELQNQRGAILASQKTDKKNKQPKPDTSKFDREIGEITRQMQSQQIKLAKVKVQIDGYRESTDKATNEIIALKSRENTLKAFITEAKNFIDELKNRPTQLVERLTTNINNVVDKFEKDHPANQSNEVQICLFGLKKKIAFIQSQKSQPKNLPKLDYPELNPEYSAPNDENYEARLQFALLTGLLWDELIDIQNKHNEEKNDAFFKMLSDLVFTTHTNLNTDLPDDLALMKGSVLNMYKEVQRNHSNQLTSISANDFDKLSEQRYQHAFSKLELQIKQARASTETDQNLLALAAEKVLTRIETMMINPKAAFDRKLATNILTRTSAIALNCKDITQLRDYLTLADKVNGAPEVWKLVAGCMLAVLGAAIITASALAAIATFGGSSYLSAVGIVIGATITAKSLTTLTALTGTAIACSGLGLFNHGKRKGLSKDMVELVQTASTVNTQQLNKSRAGS
jgi:hypothetical protein